MRLPFRLWRLTMAKRKWNDYLWIATILYFALGIFNILFAWLGMICFITPLLIAVVKGNKSYCNTYCGRSQLLDMLGRKFRLSRNRPTPKFLYSSWFRYGFLTFFMTMFLFMVFNTYQVFAGKPLSESITLLWAFRLPWTWADTSIVAPWIAQYSFGFFSVMLTSTMLGLISMFFFRPRTWCAFCPMGSMTQVICKLKSGKDAHHGNTGEETC